MFEWLICCYVHIWFNEKNEITFNKGKGMPGLENSRQWNKNAITGTHLVMFHTFLDTILWGFASLCINTAHLPASPHYHQTMDPCGPIWTNTSHRKTCDIPHLTKYAHWPNIFCFGSDREAYLRQKTIGWKNGWNRLPCHDSQSRFI